jgi:hypothetical protein
MAETTNPAFAGILEVELAGLEPATSWVRSVRNGDSGRSRGMIKLFLTLREPAVPLRSHALLTTNSPRLAKSVAFDSNGPGDILAKMATS